jgi:hypothetical protein
LEWLFLDQNSFEGSVPQSLKNLKGLDILNVTMNKMYESIPNALCSVVGLQELYLAHNNLSGLIPTCLQNLTSFSKLDMSFNDLQGEVPKKGVFENGMNMLVQGNDGLCGGIPELRLAPCSIFASKNKKSHLSKSLMITLTSISVLVSSVSVIILIQLIHKKLRKRHETQLISTTEEQYERVSYHALSNGANGFSKANLVGQGSYDMVYKCTSHEGTTVAVKVFNTKQSRTIRSFCG